MAEESLLASIAWRLGSPERIAAEGLRHLLSSSEGARSALADTLRAAGADGGAIARARWTYEPEERRLIAAIDNREAEHVFIDARFWEAATFSEPLRSRERPTTLMVVVPAARCETYWTELRKRAKEKGAELGAVAEQEEPWRAAIGDGRRLLLISWKNLLDRMSGAAHSAGEEQAEVDIRQLREFTRRQEESAFLPLRSDELDTRFPRSVRSLGRLIRNTAVRASDRGWEHVGGNSRREGPYEKLRCGVSARFGMDLALWKRHGRTPLWLTVHKSDGVSIDEARRRLKSLIVDAHTGHPSVPIELPVGVDYDEVLDAVVRQLEDIAHRITGMR